MDAEGREHLLIHFWISSSPQHDPGSSKSWSRWISDLNWEDRDLEGIFASVKERVARSWESAKQAAAYVSGMTPSAPAHPPKPPLPPEQLQGEMKEDQGAWGFFGIFKGMKFAGRSRGTGHEDESGYGGQNIQWSTAEVHVDFVQVGGCQTLVAA